MKALILGYGSIGMRHAGILLDMGVDVSVVSRRNIDYKKSYNNLSSALNENKFDYIIVCSKTNEHHSDLIELKKLGYTKSILVEKPLFEKPYNYNYNNNNIFVGYNLRFTPLVEKLNEILSGKEILSVNAYVGSFLPDWRPNSDYRKSYSAKKAEGGGVLRDLSHELDYLLYLFGSCKKVTSLGGKLSQLDIDSDDIYTILMETAICPILSVHLNYLDRVPNRFIIVNTDKNTIKTDFISKTITIDDKKENFDYDRNLIYKRQHESMINKDYSRICSFDQGLEIVNLIQQIEKSAENNEGRWINN